MKSTLQPGLRHEFRYVVPPTKTVPMLYPEAPEFQRMPAVFATGFLVGLLEWACVQLVAPHLDGDSEVTLGTHVDVSHGAATPPGLEVHVQVELLRVEGRRLHFAVQAHDGVDLISSGTHQRTLVERDAFDERVGRKRAQR